MKNNKTSSYSSAGVFPVKLFHCNDIVDQYQRIKPVHIQLNLTNKCNLSCNFCSCQNRTKNSELDFHKAEKIIDTYAKLGCQAVTITGGGEPTLYKDLPKIIKLFRQSGIKVGLVTNGINIDSVKNLYMVTWIRISFDDSRYFNHNFKHGLISAINNNHEIDWSFSYVVTNNVDFGQIIRVIEFANEYGFTHIRLVSDLLDLDNVVDMDYVKKSVSDYVKDDIVIYQGRKEFTHGRRKCLISLLKPVITAEGDIYPCCGVQYAKISNMYDYDETMKMGTIEDVSDIFYKQQNFNGSNCDKCYYDSYNEALDSITIDINHKEFV
jgi:radical SAM protein with 4Fe4S-binding SPASM domain